MSITTVQLFHRIARRARGGDFTKLSMTEQTDLAEAANTALQQVYGLLPTVYKERTQGFLLPAPLAVSIALTTQSNVVPDGTFTSAQLGRSVVLDGDPNTNQVIATNRLLNPYMGSTGTVAGTVYGDAVYSTDYPFDRIVGNPRIPAQGNAMPIYRDLVPINQTSFTWGYGFAPTTGWPLYWGTQALGYSQGEEPVQVIRVTPAPTAAMVIDVRISYWPKRLTLADYDSATRVPLADQFIETALIPMGLRALMSTPIWVASKGDATVEQRAVEAEQFLRNQPGQIGPTANRVGTPVGF
jgi:hypothetical protein